MERYFSLYPNDETRAILHYQCNLRLSEALYTSLSVFELTLRNAICRELEAEAGSKEWYVLLDNPEMEALARDVANARGKISARGEKTIPSKITAELTLGFWISLLNKNYERVLWKIVRRAFRFLRKPQKTRKNVSNRINAVRKLRNRVYHNEPICWDINRIEELHNEILEVIGWMNKDVLEWVKTIDRFDNVSNHVKEVMGWD